MIIRKDFSVLETIFEEKSLSKAADRLDQHQGALSKVLSKIEDEIQQKLFVRTNRGLLPTKEGDRLYSQIRLHKKVWGEYLKAGQDHQDEVSGIVKMGGHDSVLRQFTMALADIQKTYPSLQFDFTFERSPQVTRMVLNHELDFAVVANPQPFADLVIKPLKREEVSLFSSRQNPTDFLLYNPELITTANILKNFKNEIFKMIPIKDYDFAAEMANELKGSAILPQSVADKYGLQYKVGKSFFNAKICLIFRADHVIDRNIKKLLSGLKE